jgi:imidazolonepropionase-like amidohydrolase
MNPLIKKFDSKSQFKRWQNARKNNSSIEKKILDQHKFHLLAIKKLHDAGVNIVCGTDAGIGITVPGLSIHQELQFYSNAGLSNYEGLKTATINPSKTHGIMGDIGSVEKNKIANLILLKITLWTICKH